MTEQQNIITFREMVKMDAKLASGKVSWSSFEKFMVPIANSIAAEDAKVASAMYTRFGRLKEMYGKRKA